MRPILESPSNLMNAGSAVVRRLMSCMCSGIFLYRISKLLFQNDLAEDGRFVVAIATGAWRAPIQIKRAANALAVIAKDTDITVPQPGAFAVPRGELPWQNYRYFTAVS